MEFSSPLAAMQPPPRPKGFGCGGPDMSASNGIFQGNGVRGLTSFNFNFRDMSSDRANTDYFSLNPCRGSSPAASLAADLSQNFHIDRSPRLPTPRRSLFTANGRPGPMSGVEIVTTPPIEKEATTPPIPSSSPGFGNDPMDTSPLPHKPPFLLASQVSSQSRLSTANSLTDEDMLSPASPQVGKTSHLDVPKSTRLTENKRPAFRRPSLSRTKGFSTNTVSLRSAGLDSGRPSFSLSGSSFSIEESPGSSSLSECFVESPVQGRNTSTQVAALSRLKPPLFNINDAARSSGSPCQPPPRKVPSCAARPRKLFRRSLSMYEHPEEVMKRDNADYKPCGMQSIMDVDDTHQLQLPHFIPPDEPEGLPRIRMDTLVDIIEGKHKDSFRKVMVVDCRFEYEYQGGHITGAVNHNDKEVLANELFGSSTLENTLLVFHCEYSVHRAPIMAKFIRQRDRSFNQERYPHLTYPEIYVLDGGYSSFFKTHRTRCFPQNYVEMDAKEHERACERGMNKLRQRAKFGRAHTFAVSRTSHPQESPLSQSQSRTSLVSGFAEFEDAFCSPQPRARRVASY